MIIVGGGIAGLAMANALAVRGLPSIVLERTRSPGEIDRGDVLHRSTLLILEKWGVYQELQSHKPIEFTKFRIFNNDGSQVFQFDSGRDLDSKTKFTVLRHPVIESFLEKAATNTGLVSVMRGVICTDLILENGRVIGVTTSAGDFYARVTIIANGAKSTLRDKYFKGRFLHDYHTSFYNARYKLIPDIDNCGFYVIGTRGVMIFVPLPNREMRIGLQCERDERLSQQTAEDIIRARLKTFPPWPLEFIDAHVYPVTMSLSDSLWIPGAVLIGDAAHTVHPTGGQGGNLAFQDAEIFAQYLADIGSSTPELDKACEMYSTRRHKQLKAILARIHFLAQWSLVKNPLLISLRELFLKSANKSRFAKRLIFQRVVDVS